MAQSQRNYSLDDYFDVENHSDIRFEYFAGQIFAMAGGSYRHNRIGSNLLGGLVARLRGSFCSALGSDMRVSTVSGLYTYPDGVVVCGQPELSHHPFDRGETLINPSVIIEVLSDSTRLYDLGEKFDHYRAIPSLRECIFVEQNLMSVERRWVESGEWRSETLRGAAERLRFLAVPVEIPLSEIYDGVL
ncbi:MAG TPA: Uma2 family endonuclease [Thermoanaerobaculia bacterium]|nr:Uma2 family endonuclease [Thermoanaerobaculia bacterium]